MLKGVCLRMAEFCPSICTRKYLLTKPLQFHQAQAGITSRLHVGSTNKMFTQLMCVPV